MAEKKPLRIWGAFGPSRDKTLLLACHPDEDATPNRRTLVLALKGHTATFVEERPLPLIRAWYSRGSGTAYCTSRESNKLHLWRAGKWSEEVFSPAPVKSVMFVFGLDGPTPEEDQLFLTTTSGFFARIGNKWTQHKLRGSTHANQIHGRKPTEIYIGGETLWKWNGKKATQLEGPEDDVPEVVWVTSDDRLIVGDTYLSISDAKGEWERLETRVEQFGALDELDDKIYATTDDGVMQLMLDGGSALVSPRVEVLRFANMGDALVAIGTDACVVGKGLSWQSVKVPSCEVGKRP